MKTLKTIIARSSLALLFVLHTHCSVIVAQPQKLPTKNITFEQLPIQLGLSQNTINCILQDKQGYLWIGTWSGLIRYDGYSTITYHSGNLPGQLKSDKITTIYEDYLGRLWIGTLMAGLFQFDPFTKQFVQYNHDPKVPGSLSNNNVWCIREDKNNLLWVGTENGLNLFDRGKGRFMAYSHSKNNPSSLSSNHVTSLCLLASGQLCIGTTNGLNILTSPSSESLTFHKYFYSKEPAYQDVHNYIYGLNELVANGKSSLWFCTARGLKKYQDGTIDNFTVKENADGFNSLINLKVINGTRPFLMIGSEKGISFFDPYKNQYSRLISGTDDKFNLSNASVTYLYIDRSNVLWAGTKKGINKFDCYTKNFDAYKTSTFDKSQGIITGIQGSGKNNCFLSTLGGGLFQFSYGKFHPVSLDVKINKDQINYIQTLHLTRSGAVFLGTAGSGVYQFKTSDIDQASGIVKRFQHFGLHTSPAIGGDYIMSICEDSRGNVWIGSWETGLTRIGKDKKITIYTDSLLRTAPLVVIFEDTQQHLWVGTRGNGLYQVIDTDTSLTIKKWQSTDNRQHGLTNDFINSICQDPHGKLWIGTEEGLLSFNPVTQVFKQHQFNSGFANGGIATILPDNHGKLWLAQHTGLTVIDPNQPDNIIHYDYHDHIQGGFFYNNVGYRTPAGELFFGGAEGFNVINPETVLKNTNEPTVIINEFKVFGKSVSPVQKFESQKAWDVTSGKQLPKRLQAKQNSISFEFTASEYGAPDKVRYAYKLDGFDQDWKYTNALQRIAVYTNLNEGSYTFKVKAANSDGIWSKQITKVPFFIVPPWYKTYWAFAVYVVIGLLGLHAFRKIIIIQAGLKHDLKFERLQRENLEKLNQAKLQFFTNISHEFRTPLTLILGPTQSLIDTLHLPPKEKEQLLVISNNANRLLRLINQLLDFRKVESGNLKLEVSQRNIVKFVRDIKFSFEALAEMLTIDFYFVASSNVIQLWFDPDQLEKIMFNLLSNSFKNTPPGGKITVSIKEEMDRVLVMVEDNGKGIKLQHFDKIFETFFSYDEDKHHTGTGIGLAFAKSLVEMHHGTLEFTSDVNLSTKFKLALQKGCQHFDASEISAVSHEDAAEAQEKEAPTFNAHSDKAHGLLKIPENNLPVLLIVEDNYDVRAYLKDIFCDYHVLVATNGKEGIELAIDKMPHLIISDVMMPEMDGIQFCNELKSNVKTSHIPVVLLTARTSILDKVEGLQTGADDYILKPFNPNVLKLKVRNLIYSREAMRSMFQDSKVLLIEPKNVTLTITDEAFVKNALEGIEKNMSNPDYGVDDLGKDVGMSRTQLYRKLKALTGQSANEFIRTIRLKRAAQLLEQHQLTIAEVTHRVGFTDLQYFRDCFKKLFGSIPSEYVQSSREKVAKNQTGM